MRWNKRSILKEKRQLKSDWRKQVEIMLNFILGLAVTLKSIDVKLLRERERKQLDD